MSASGFTLDDLSVIRVTLRSRRDVILSMIRSSRESDLHAENFEFWVERLEKLMPLIRKVDAAFQLELAK